MRRGRDAALPATTGCPSNSGGLSGGTQYPLKLAAALPSTPPVCRSSTLLPALLRQRRERVRDQGARVLGVHPETG